MTTGLDEGSSEQLKRHLGQILALADPQEKKKDWETTSQELSTGFDYVEQCDFRPKGGKEVN